MRTAAVFLFGLLALAGKLILLDDFDRMHKSMLAQDLGAMAAGYVEAGDYTTAKHYFAASLWLEPEQYGAPHPVVYHNITVMYSRELLAQLDEK